LDFSESKLVLTGEGGTFGWALTVEGFGPH
jgi:hypothetical protein